jgi:ankyrin repeat protein
LTAPDTAVIFAIDINRVDHIDRTALSHAAECKYTEIVEMLLATDSIARDVNKAVI